MREIDNCSGCPQHHDCKSMYQALGKAEGSFVALRSVAAFLVPIVIFALSLAVFDKILKKSIPAADLRTIISAAGSLLTCSIYVIAYRLFSAQKGNTCQEMKETKNRN